MSTEPNDRQATELGCRAHSLIADVAVMAAGSVLMVKYADAEQYDGQTGWFLPDDELRRLEHPARAARRIAQEQLGIRPEGLPLRLGTIQSFQGNSGTWHLSFHYVAEFDAAPEVLPAAPVKEARWFPLDDLPPRDEVAHHGWALSILAAIARGSEAVES